MDRPYLFCHMLTSLDGKIMGNYMDLPACEPAGELFYDIAFGDEPFYRHQGWLSGRVTTDDNFTHYRTPDLDPTAPPVPPGDFIAGKAPMYYVSVDPRGVLGWQENTVTYETTTAQVIEVLTGQASNAYKAFLRQKGISYLLAGEDKLDYALLLENPAPTRDEVREWFQKNRNVCRCTGYIPIINAVMDAAAVMRGDKSVDDIKA